MITPSFALTATERVLPRLALDFTTASLDSRITFTRSGATATRVNASGFIETMVANTPRFDFNPVTLVCKGLLIEEPRTNLKLYSQDLSNALAWSATFLTTLASGFTSPDNTTNGVKATNTAGITSLLQANIAITPSATNVYYPTIFVKKGNVSTVTLNVYYATGTEYNVFFNLDTLAVTGAPVANAFIFENYGNGWYRIGYQVPADATGLQNQMNYRIWESSRGAGVAGNFQYYFGAQLEIGAFATSYIPTVASQVTRTADVATMTGANFSSWYNAGAGGIVTRVLPSTVSGTCPAFQIDDNTANGIIVLRGNTTNPELSIVDGGAPQSQIDAGTIAANTVYNLGAAWNTNNCAAAVNGGAAVTDNTATIPTVTQARLGSDGTNYLNGQLQTVRYWPQRIIDAEVQAFSKG
jgi:hypothetical protein